MKKLVTYIEEGFYKNIGSSRWVKNCDSLIDTLISCQFDDNIVDKPLQKYNIYIDRDNKVIELRSKNGELTLYTFDLRDGDNAKRLCSDKVDLSQIDRIELFKIKRNKTTLDITYGLPNGKFDFICLSQSDKIQEGFYSNVHTSPLDTVRDFILDNEDIALNGTVIERMKLVNKLAEVFQSEYDRVGAFTFQFGDNWMTCAVKVDGDNSRWKWGGKGTRRHWGKPHTIKQIAQEVVSYQIIHQSGDLVNFELI